MLYRCLMLLHVSLSRARVFFFAGECACKAVHDHKLHIRDYSPDRTYQTHAHARTWSKLHFNEQATRSASHFVQTVLTKSKSGSSRSGPRPLPPPQAPFGSGGGPGARAHRLARVVASDRHCASPTALRGSLSSLACSPFLLSWLAC